MTNQIPEASMKMLQREAAEVFRTGAGYSFVRESERIGLDLAIEHALNHALEEGIVQLPLKEPQIELSEFDIDHPAVDAGVDALFGQHPERGGQERRQAAYNVLRAGMIYTRGNVPTTWMTLAHAILRATPEQYVDGDFVAAAHTLAERVLGESA